MKLLLAIILTVASPALVFAQVLPNTVGGLEITVSNDNPAPGQEVTITARSYTIDISAANITWSADGRVIEKGVGANVIKVTAPKMSKSLSITISVISAGGTSFQETLKITPSAVDMIVEADGYVPAMFPGKIRPAYQNGVKVIAVPHLTNSNGAEIDPKTLVYKWEQNGSALENQSGYGKQAITIPGNAIPRPYIISVTVSTRDASVHGAGIISVTPGQPTIGFYRNDPLYGPLYNSAVTNTVYMGASRETSIIAIPYGFNATSLSNLEMKWRINSRERPELAQNHIVTLRAPEGEAGTSDVTVSMRNVQKLLQQGTASFQAIFSASATNPSLNF